MHESSGNASDVSRSVDVLSAVVDGAPVAMLLCAPDGRIVLANREACALFGYPLDELRGLSVDMLVPAAHRAAHPARRAGYYVAPVVRAMGSGRDLRALCRDGTEIPVEIGLTPIAAPAGTPPYTLAVVLDLRERLRMQQALRDANDALERRVAERTAELQAALVALERMSREDVLTGLSNRRDFDQRLLAEVERAERLATPLAVAMLDLDHFKRVNDACGHAGGDAVLRSIGLLLRRQCRSIDLVARYGGEEFAIAYPATALPEAVASCERIRIAVERFDWHAIVPTLPHPVTISAGVAEWRPGIGPRALLDAADANLYRAKHEGRNRVLPGPAAAG